MNEAVNNWTPELEKLLKQWRAQVEYLQKAHKKMRRIYQYGNTICGVPASALSFFVVIGIFATFQNCDCSKKSNTTLCTVEEWIRFSVGIIAAVGFGYEMVYRFLGWEGKSVEHKNAADAFEALYRAIDIHLKSPPIVRGDALLTLQSIRNQFDDTVKSSIGLPKRYDVSLNYRIITPDDVPRAPDPDRITDFVEDEDTLRRVLNDSPSDSGTPEEAEIHFSQEVDFDCIQPESLEQQVKLSSMMCNERANLGQTRIQRLDTLTPLGFEIARFEHQFEKK